MNRSRRSRSKSGRVSLAEEYSPTTTKQKAGKKRKQSPTEEDNDDRIIETKASRRILKFGQELAEEEQNEYRQTQPNKAFTFDSRFGEPTSDEVDPSYDDDEEAWGDEDEEIVEDDINPDDQDIFNKFLPSNKGSGLDPNTLSFDPVSNSTEGEERGPGTNLADLILEKIAAHEAGNGDGDPAAGPGAKLGQEDGFEDAEMELPPKVVEVYSTIGNIMSRHRSGPLPKPFKILPSLPIGQIPILVSLTRPEEWTPMSLFLATRLFISSKPAVAQPFLTSILLPRVRTDIHDTKKLNVHLYNALKKSLYKPACFFKGILFPLLEGQDGPCTLREAHIISSVVARVSVPSLHSAAALLRLCDLAAEQFSSRHVGGGSATSATNVFIKKLLEKKYALPYKVIDALVFHFIRFKAVDPNAITNSEDIDTAMTDGPGGVSANDSSKLPLLWHQCLLAFAQRYRNDITEDQREALLDVVQIRGHSSIGPEVRRELLEGRGRGVYVDGPTGNDASGDMNPGAEKILRMGGGIPGPSTGVALEGGDDTMVMG